MPTQKTAAPVHFEQVLIVSFNNNEHFSRIKLNVIISSKYVCWRKVVKVGSAVSLPNNNFATTKSMQ